MKSWSEFHCQLGNTNKKWKLFPLRLVLREKTVFHIEERIKQYRNAPTSCGNPESVLFPILTSLTVDHMKTWVRENKNITSSTPQIVSPKLME